jgi:hypothetical protein
MSDIAPIKQEYFPLGGGLDVQSPALAIPSGMVIDAQNYEPEISGGYRRIDGYERFDGSTSPSSASYWTLGITVSAGVSTGATIVGATSAATAKVLGSFGTNYILGRLTGTFITGENITVSAVVVGVTTSASALNSATSASTHADYIKIAADDYRADIQAITGSGQIRGVWVYKDVVYAFRDNVGGTAGNMWKATAGGWVQVVFGNQFSFGTGLAQPTVGQTIKGATSGATGVITAVLTRAGTWGSTAAGTIVYTVTAGTFSSGELIKDSGLTTTYCTTTSAGAAITRAAGGQCEFVNANFTGSTDTQKMYGVDGVNPCFEFDGTTYVPIYTGMTTDTPAHVIVHKFYLMLAFKGSLQVSGLGLPYAWSVVLGSAEIGVSETITGMVPQGGNVSGSSLAIFTSNRVYIMYGTTVADFKLVNSIYDIGYFAGTMQPVSNTTYGLTPRGIQNLVTTLTYGDFDFAAVSHKIQSLLVSKRGMQTVSNSSRIKDQFRIYFNDGTAIAMGLSGDQVNGFMPLNYGKAVRCIVTASLTTGQEVTYFGDDDGYVYQDNIGTSFDGSAIESWIRLPFNHSKSPQVRKRYRKAIFEVKVAAYSQVNISYDLGYADPDISPSAVTSDKLLIDGGYWDQFTWDQFTWDSKYVSNPSISLEGTAKNISLLFYSNRAQDQSHTLQGTTIVYSPRRLDRA